MYKDTNAILWQLECVIYYSKSCVPWKNQTSRDRLPHCKKEDVECIDEIVAMLFKGSASNFLHQTIATSIVQ